MPFETNNYCLSVVTAHVHHDTHSYTKPHPLTHTKLERPKTSSMHVSYWIFHITVFMTVIPFVVGTSLFFTPPPFSPFSPPLFSQDLVDSLSNVYGSLKEEDLWCERESRKQASATYTLCQILHSQGSVYCTLCTYSHSGTPL